MAALSIQVPYPVFYDRDGQPLDNGNIFIGVANLDPVTNPLQVYYDEALTIPASQPLKTSNGYIYRNGTPAQLYVNAVNFSILVKDEKGLLVYSFPDGTGISPNASGVAFTGFKGQVGFVSDLAGNDGSDWIGFDPDGVGAVARSAQDKMRDIVSVKDFGAVGDADPISGIGTDDTAAIQAAINSTGTTDCLLTVYFPDGCYRITDTLTLPEGVALTGGGAWKAKIHSVATGPAIEMVAGGTYDFPPIVKNLAVYSSGDCGVKTSGISGAEINDNWFSGVTGIKIDGTADIIINRNTFDGTINGVLFDTGSATNNIQIANNSFTGNAFAITLQNTRDCRITANAFRGDASHNIHIYSPSSANTSTGVVICDNTFYTASSLGAANSQVMKLTGTLSNFIIANNTIEGSKGPAISSDAGTTDTFTISSNQFKNVGEEAIFIQNLGGTVKISDNIFASGIVKNAVKYNTSTGNLVLQNNVILSANTGLGAGLAGAGIDIDQVALAVISDNVCTAPDVTYGLLVRATATMAVINDNYFATGTLFKTFVATATEKTLSHQTPQGNQQSYANAAPTAGTWAVGDIVWNTNPVSAGYIGWVCTVAGSPGTWVTFGLIS